MTALEIQPRLRRYLHGHKNAVTAVAFERGGLRMATGDVDGDVIVWDATHWQQVASFHAHDAGVLAAGYFAIGGVAGIGFLPDGASLVTTGADGKVRVWDLGTRTSRVELDMGAGIAAVAIPRGDVLIAAGDSKVVRLDASTLLERSRARLPNAGAASAAFVSDTVFVTSTNDSKLLLWDLSARAQPIDELYWHQTSVPAVAADLARHRIYSGGDDGQIAIWDEAMRVPVGPMLRASTGAIWGLALSPDGAVLASVGSHGEARLWEVAPERWRRLACELANRNLTCDEWRQYLPHVSYRALCSEAGA